MEETFVNHLLASSGLTALVGPRITWAKRPQASALPSIVLHRIAGAPLYADEGEVGLSSARIQVDIWAKDAGGESGYLIAKRVAREMLALMTPAARFSSGNFIFSACFLENEQDSFERGAGGDELYRVRQDFIIWYKET